MSHRSIRAAVAAVALFAASAAVHAEQIIGLTSSNSIVFFDSATPGTVTAPLAVTGLAVETLLDIDLRPATGQLYGFSNLGNLYSINTTTGAATLSASLVGTSVVPEVRYGIDFNPTVDRLRIVGNNGQDLRLTPGTSVTTIDTALNGAASSAVSAAYTNNDNNPATGTTLFYISTEGTDSLYNTSNPNGGVMTLVGSLGVTTSNSVGFDISGLTATAFASFASPTGGGSSLYTINLGTGAATLVGTIGGNLQLNGITAAAIPEPSSLALLAPVAGLLLRRRK